MGSIGIVGKENCQAKNIAVSSDAVTFRAKRVIVAFCLHFPRL
jgi:hypothetical protein